MNFLKITIAAICMLCLINVTNAQNDKFKPYVGLGSSLSAGVKTYSLEAGMWNDKVWYAIAAEQTPIFSNKISKPITYIGPKFYYKIAKSSYIDVFGYAATKVGISEKRSPLAFEPGACVIFNVTSNIGIQWSASLPVLEDNFTGKRTSYLNSGICVNWFF